MAKRPQCHGGIEDESCDDAHPTISAACDYGESSCHAEKLPRSAAAAPEPLDLREWFRRQTRSQDTESVVRTDPPAYIDEVAVNTGEWEESEER
jgi:hypothetical protein